MAGETWQRIREVFDSALRREPRSVYLRIDPLFDALRDDPRFDDLVSRVGLK